MTNETWYSAFFLGMGITIALVGIFQVGINIGVRTCIGMLDGQYPAAMQYLNKHKTVAKVLPYVMSSSGE